MGRGGGGIQTGFRADLRNPGLVSSSTLKGQPGGQPRRTKRQLPFYLKKLGTTVSDSGQELEKRGDPRGSYFHWVKAGTDEKHFEGRPAQRGSYREGKDQISYQCYFADGKLHREDGPAQITKNETTEEETFLWAFNGETYFSERAWVRAKESARGR